MANKKKEVSDEIGTYRVHIGIKAKASKKLKKQKTTLAAEVSKFVTNIAKS